MQREARRLAGEASSSENGAVETFCLVAPADRRCCQSAGEAFGRDSGGTDALSRLSRYETSMERSLYKTLHELQRLQAVRHGKEVAMPLAVDIDVSGDPGRGSTSYDAAHLGDRMSRVSRPPRSYVRCWETSCLWEER